MLKVIESIIDLMADNAPRTSYEICDLLFGTQPNGARWWRVAGACDWLVEHGQLATDGKDNHRTLYRLNRFADSLTM